MDLSSSITRKAALIPTLTRGKPVSKCFTRRPAASDATSRGARAEERKAKVTEAENDVAEAEALVRRPAEGLQCPRVLLPSALRCHLPC